MPKRWSTVSRPDAPSRRGGHFGAIAGTAFLLLFALVLVACSSPSNAPAAGPNGVALLSSAAVSATIGPAGGELTTADPDRGRSYRLSIPAGALREDTEVTMTPIAAIENFPFEGGLLGGVELEPSGTKLLGPASLTVSLDAERQAELRSGLEGDQIVLGFNYPGDTTNAAEDIGLARATVSDDRSTIGLTLFSFSGHGPGRGNGGNAANRPCRQQDRTQRYVCEIEKVYARAGIADGDPVDAATEGEVANVFRRWLDELEPELDLYVNNSEAWSDAAIEATNWASLANFHGYLSDVWYAAGDDLAFEGARLEDAVFRSYTAGIDAANQKCVSDQALDDLLRWIDLGVRLDFGGIPVPPFSGLGALAPSAFCLILVLEPESAVNPTELAEGESGEFRFRIRDGARTLATDTQLAMLFPRVIIRPADPSLLAATGDHLSLAAYADVTALRAVPGQVAEGTFTIALQLFGLQVDYATRLVTVDITEPGATPCTGAVGPATGPVTVAFLVEDECTPPSEITCSGDPATILNHNDVPENISIRFDGESTCSVVPELNSDDDPDVIVGFDSDPGDSGWDSSNLSGNWENDREGAQEVSPGTYTVRAVHLPTDRAFTVTFTVDVTLVGGGPDVMMTVRDVTIRPVTKIMCSGDPATTTYRTGERIAIIFNGTECDLVADVNDDDDPDVALVLDTDESQPDWNGGSGSNWRRESIGDNEPPGAHSVVITRKATGEQYQLSFTVDVVVLSAGDVRLTVRDVTISPAGADI